MKIKSFIILVAALAVSVSAFAQDPANEVKKKFNTAATHHNNKEYDKALPLLEECVVEGLDADVMEVVESAQKLIPNCYFRIGLKLVNEKKLDQALEVLATADERARLYNDAKVARSSISAISKVYALKGATSFNSRDYASAVVEFAKGYEANPQNTDLALNLAMSYCELKDFENGVRVYTDIIALEKRHSKFAAPAAEAKRMLSNYLLVKAQEENKAGDKEAAYATLETLINADFMNYTNQFYRLQTAAGNQDWENLIAWGEDAVATATTPEESSEIYYLIAVAHDTLNNNQTAVDSYKQVTAGDKLEPSTKRIVELEAFIKAEKEAK